MNSFDCRYDINAQISEHEPLGQTEQLIRLADELGDLLEKEGLIVERIIKP